MYIDHIHIKSLKLLKDFELDFRRPDGSPRMWTAIIGRNGTAKTSILQAIALTAAGSKQVNRIAAPVVGHLRDRRSSLPLELEATYSFSERARVARYHPRLGHDIPAATRLKSYVSLNSTLRTLDAQAAYSGQAAPTLKLPPRKLPEMDPLDLARAENLPLWFVAGYGISRFLPDPSSTVSLEQPSIERLEALFNNRTTLTSLRFIDYFAGKKAKGFASALRDAVTNVAGLIPGLVGIELRGKGGVTKAGDLIDRDRLEFDIGGARQKFPAVAMSHGYQSTLAWIADLIGHVMLEADQPIPAADIEGVVLVDEIDLYLHPTWQAGLVSALRKTFPKVQFIVTTHSPVVLASLAPEEIVVVDHHPSTGDVVRFAHDEEGKLAPKQAGGESRTPDPRAMTGTDLYRFWFDLDRLTLNPHGAELREYLSLATDPLRTDEEEARVEDLEKNLESAGIGEVREAVLREEA